MAVQLVRSTLQRCHVASTLFPRNAFLSPRPAYTPPPCAAITPYVSDKRGEYKKKIKVAYNRDTVKESFKAMKQELKKFKDQNIKKLDKSELFSVKHGDYKAVWKFDNENSIKDWIVTSDKDHKEGKSQAEFLLGPQKTGIFRGYLNTDVPKDGVVRKAGYCNITSPLNRKSFFRQEPLDWTAYTHLLVRCRGDGRPYHLVVHLDKHYDVQWNDTYEYGLFTRGGPYWQIAKIPFSKFYLASKGRIQDKQEPIPLDEVLGLGITIGDKAKGPFQLEIDFIGLINDESHGETFAYELYQAPTWALY